MRWTEIWRQVQQDRKGRNLADHAAMLEAFPDPAARKSFLTYKKSSKIRAIKTIAGQARKWREIQNQLFLYDFNDSEDNEDRS